MWRFFLKSLAIMCGDPLRAHLQMVASIRG
jgi:hypothetical protein